MAHVYQDDLDVNAEMIKLGAAWVYRHYAKDQKLYEYEKKAREAKTGLWGLPKADQVPPWEWRRKGVKASEPIKTDTPTEKALIVVLSVIAKRCLAVRKLNIIWNIVA